MSARLKRLIEEKQRRRGDLEFLRRYCAALDFGADDWQLEILAAREKRIAALTGRQSGKSTVMGMRAALAAASGPKCDVLLVAPTLRQSKELFKKAHAFATHPNARMPRLIQEAGLSLELANHSRIIALPGAPQNIRGFSAIRAVCIDEAAFVPTPVFQAVSPMLAVSSGDLLCMSTAWLPEGFFYEAMERNPDWKTWRIPATENPRIDARFLEQERRAMGPEKFGAEYECRWLPQGAFAVFDIAMIEEASRDWQPLLNWNNYL